MTLQFPTTASSMGESIPFDAHVELIQLFLAHREEIVQKIATLLNAQRKPIQYLQDSALLSRHFEDCFFTLGVVTREQARLRGALQEAHWAGGFRPRPSPGLHNDLVDPAEMMVRVFHLWRQTHWPGNSGRIRYANILFNLYVIRCLALLTMRLWDGDANHAGNRLPQAQGVLDQLWRSSPGDHAVLVRDVRWLIPVAQSPTTNELAAYFQVAEQIAETLSDEHRMAIHNASVRMAGGHLRSQLRHISIQKELSLTDPGLVLSTRRSNALDIALIMQGLVPLLEAYELALCSADSKKRLELADGIYQAVSPDPELFLNRLDLLGPYSMIEDLFITTDGDEQVRYTPTGSRHVRLFREYQTRITRVRAPLYEDCQHFPPASGAYSPYGVLYGFSSNLIEHMAFKTLQLDAVTPFGLEDLFVDGQADKLAWVNGWRKLPHVPREMVKTFEYPQQFAEEVFRRIQDALRRSVSDGKANSSVQTGRLFILDASDVLGGSEVPDLSTRYIRSSDLQIVAAGKADFYDEALLLHDRMEGEFLLSYKTPGGWVAISKDVLTEVLATGQNVKIAALPRVAAEVLRLMGLGLVS
jgi:hypothetical protein